MAEHAAIVVTGGSGFLGAWVCRALREADPAVPLVAVGRRPHSPEHLQAGVTYVAGDLLDPATYGRLPRRIGCLVHLAGDRRPRPSPEAFHEQVRMNVELTDRAADYAAAARARLVLFASSAAVYSGGCPMPLTEDRVTALPLDHLGATKLAAEALLKARAAAGLFAVKVLRIFTAYGPGARNDQFIPSALEKLTADAPVARFGAADTERDFVYAADVARAFAAAHAASQHDDVFDVLNIATGRSWPIGEVIERLRRLLGVTIPMVFEAPAAAGADHHRADISRATARLGWRAAVGLDEGLALTVEAWRAAAGSRRPLREVEATR